MAARKKAYERFSELTRRATGARASETGGRDGSPEPDAPSADTVAVRLSPEVRRALVHQARVDQTNPSEIIEEALRRYLDLPR